jgi:hypothetical protein
VLSVLLGVFSSPSVACGDEVLVDSRESVLVGALSSASGCVVGVSASVGVGVRVGVSVVVVVGSAVGSSVAD